MKVEFLGAAQTVTGSCYMIEACGARFTVDCGMHQGNKAIEERNQETDMYRAADIDFILMTHAHIDHSGLLPRMVKDGFKNPIYCTPPTKDLLEILLLDSAHIQEMEAKQRAEKYKRRGKGEAPAPLYETIDAENTMPLFSDIEYDKTFEPHPGIKVTFHDAGHIIGSAFLYVEVTENGKTTTAIFSGDLGRANAYIMRDPEVPRKADFIFLESTYGDREHNTSIDPHTELAEAIAYSYKNKEKVIIPAFAVERTQEILYCLHQLAKDGKLPDDMPIYVDSPLAIRATDVFKKHVDLFDDEAKALLAKGEDPFSLPNLHYTMDAQESRTLNEMGGSAIIVSASGMCNAGRIRHHLRHNIWKPGASVVFVGYQGVGTPGRKIVEKAASITLFGDDIPIAAKIFTIGGFSAHAGQAQLIEWAGQALADHSQIILVHGEEKAQQVLGEKLKQKYGVDVAIPAYLDELILERDAEAVYVNAPRKERAEQKSADAVPTTPALGVARTEPSGAPVDWAYLKQELEFKMQKLHDKIDTLSERPWVEQSELRDSVNNLSYELSKLMSRL